MFEEKIAIPHQEGWTDDGLQVDHARNAPEVDHKRMAQEGIHYELDTSPPETSSNHGLLPSGSEKAGKRLCGIQRRWFLVVVVCTVVVVAVIAGVLASRHSRGSKTVGTPVETAIPTTSRISDDTKLAAVAFNDTNNILQYRVYFQDDADNVKESAWNESSRTWYLANESVVKAKPGTPLAAAATGLPQFPSPQISLYVLNTSNHINEWTSDLSSPSTWSPGSINDHQFQAADDSSLAAIAHVHPGCFSCDNNTIVAYKDSNSKINVGRGNSTVWTMTTLPVSGDGLSLLLKWYPNGATTGIRIIYQNETAIYDYAWDVEGNDTDPSFTNWKPLLGFPALVGSNGSIASFAYGTNWTTGLPTNMEILSSSSHGVTNLPWLGSPSTGTFEDTQEPSVMESLDAYTPLAANGDGRVYGMQNGLIKEYVVSADGKSTWTFVGDVVTE